MDFIMHVFFQSHSYITGICFKGTILTQLNGGNLKDNVWLNLRLPLYDTYCISTVLTY